MEARHPCPDHVTQCCSCLFTPLEPYETTRHAKAGGRYRIQAALHHRWLRGFMAVRQAPDSSITFKLKATKLIYAVSFIKQRNVGLIAKK